MAENRASQPASRPDHLDHHRTVVALGGRVHPLDRLRRRRHGGVEADAPLGAGHVVVDRLRDPDDPHAGVGDRLGGAQRPVAADHHHGVDALALDRVEDGAQTALVLGGVEARGAEHRAAARDQTVGGGERQLDALALGDALQPCRNATTSSPKLSWAPWTTARITAFRPGQSPPPVSSPMRMALATLRAVQPERAAGGLAVVLVHGPNDPPPPSRPTGEKVPTVAWRSGPSALAPPGARAESMGVSRLPVACPRRHPAGAQARPGAVRGARRGVVRCRQCQHPSTGS